MHAVEGAWPVSVESQWLAVFVVAGRPLNTPPGCFIPQAKPEQILRRNGQQNGRLAAVKRIVQQTDWPRCIRIDSSLAAVTHGVALLRRFWLIRNMGGEYTCKVRFRARVSSASFA